VAFQRVGPTHGEGPLRVDDHHRASFATTIPFRSVRPTARATVAAESLPLPSPSGNGVGQLADSPRQPV
jgi:hypothetical protein